MLELHNVSRTFVRGSAQIRALRDANASIDDGAVVAIQGPSGSGKTTLLSLVGTLDRPSSGMIFLDGQDVWALPDRGRCHLRSRSIGFVFQSFNLIHEYPAWKNVALPLRYCGTRFRERKRRALEALEAVGLEDRVHHLPSQLSGGEEQRVAIARSLVISPRLLLADEPTGNLDTQTGEQVMFEILSLGHGDTITLIVTHDPSIAKRCPRTLKMHDGELLGA